MDVKNIKVEIGSMQEGIGSKSNKPYNYVEVKYTNLKTKLVCYQRVFVDYNAKNVLERTES